MHSELMAITAQALGSGQLTAMKLAITDNAGALVTKDITTGRFEIGQGFYGWSLSGNVPDAIGDLVIYTGGSIGGGADFSGVLPIALNGYAPDPLGTAQSGWAFEVPVSTGTTGQTIYGAILDSSGAIVTKDIGPAHEYGGGCYQLPLTGLPSSPRLYVIYTGGTIGGGSDFTGVTILQIGILFPPYAGSSPPDQVLTSGGGNVTLPIVTDVKSGVDFGSNNSLTGTYTGGGGSGGINARPGASL